MTWVADRRLWRKVQDGQTHYASCKQLREWGYEVISDTKEGSKHAANLWWARKLFELEAAKGPAARPPQPLENVLAAWTGDPEVFHDPDKAIRYLFAHLMRQAQEREQAEARAALPYDENPESPPDPHEIPLAAYRAAFEGFLQHHVLGGQPLPTGLGEAVAPAQLQLVEASIKGLRGEPAAAPEKRLGALAEAWLAGQKLRAAAGDISLGAWDNKRLWVGPFLDFVGRDSAAEAVTDPLLDAWDNHCLGRRAAGAWKDYFARDVRMTAKEFVRWLADRGAIPRPAYLTRKSRRFRLEGREIRPWSAAEFRRPSGPRRRGRSGSSWSCCWPPTAASTRKTPQT
jgi:hypothetical protein